MCHNTFLSKTIHLHAHSKANACTHHASSTVRLQGVLKINNRHAHLDDRPERISARVKTTCLSRLTLVAPSAGNNSPRRVVGRACHIRARRWTSRFKATYKLWWFLLLVARGVSEPCSGRRSLSRKAIRGCLFLGCGFRRHTVGPYKGYKRFGYYRALEPRPACPNLT